MHNAALLRQGKLAEVDLLNVAEELESMGRSEKRELLSRFEVLLVHLLKWSYQANRRSNSWKDTIWEQRRRIELLLKDSPSLKHRLAERVADAYPGALVAAARETNLPKETFPKICPYSLEQILDEDFYPSAN
jgi:hypothetical protein